MDSILTTVKKHCNVPEEYDAFDDEIIDHINTVFSDLHQMGVGPKECFEIEDATATWKDFDPNVSTNSVRTYMKNRVKLVFDPPTSSSVLASMERQIEKAEWRLTHGAEIKT